MVEFPDCSFSNISCEPLVTTCGFHGIQNPRLGNEHLSNTRYLLHSSWDTIPPTSTLNIHLNDWPSFLPLIIASSNDPSSHLYQDLMLCFLASLSSAIDLQVWVQAL